MTCPDTNGLDPRFPLSKKAVVSLLQHVRNCVGEKTIVSQNEATREVAGAVGE